MQYNMKHNNIHIIGTPEGEEDKEQGIENLFEKVVKIWKIWKIWKISLI